jgi:hypothetical protein
MLAFHAGCLAQGDEFGSSNRYTGFSKPEFANVEVWSTYVPTPDGERLAVDVYLPTAGPTQERFPAVLQYTPYQRATVNPATGEVRGKENGPLNRMLLQHGYVMVWADMRGTGASTGWLLDFFPPIWDDGKVLVDWIAAQDWSDGNVGMMGASYLGWSQTATASRKPKALKCIMPSVIPLEGFTGEIYPGGIYLQGFMSLWSGHMLPVQRNYLVPDGGVRPTRPALDEDGDGDLVDEVPMDQNGNGTFLDEEFPPIYADGAIRTRHVYYEATKAHEKNYDYHSWAQHMPFIDGKSPLGYTISELGPAAHVQDIREFGIPIYNVGGWFDGFTRGSFELWCSLEQTNPSKLVLFPGYHNVVAGGYYDYLNLDRNAFQELLSREHLRFFDRYLKGMENGIDTEPPIHYYVMNGEGWRGAEAWPPPDAEPRAFYCASDGRLLDSKPGAGTDSYRVDLTHNATFGDNEGNRWVGISGRAPGRAQDRMELDKQCLTYDTPPLDAPVEVTGHPIVSLWVSSTAPHGDFFVYLEDVSPSGEAIQVTEGQLRAGFAALKDNDLIVDQTMGAFDVLPELPWHGYRKEDYVDGILKHGAVVELVLDLLPTSWVFRKGHQIRMTVAGADYPTFRLHPKLSPANDPSAPDNVVPTIQLYHGGDRASAISVPILEK